MSEPTRPFYTTQESIIIKAWQQLYAHAVNLPMLDDGDRFLLLQHLNSCRQIIQSNAAQRMQKGKAYSVDHDGEINPQVAGAREVEVIEKAPPTIAELKQMNESRVSPRRPPGRN